MRLLPLLVLATISTGVPAEVQAQPSFPGSDWTVATDPDELGWSSERLRAAKRYSDSIGSAAVMIIQRGIVVHQWGDVTRPMDVFSVRKSLLSALIGVAVGRGQIDTSSTLEHLGIDDEPPSLTAAEKTARVVDLLTSRSGVYHPAAYETPAMERERPARGSHTPGTFFYYNNWDFNALGSIYESAAGSSVFDAFEREVASRIGMQDLRPEHMKYVADPKSRHRAYTFQMSARDLARFGLLYLHNGSWNGDEIVPADWVQWSTSALADQGVRGGYGAMWWVATDPSDPIINVPVGTFSARGTGEQNVFVLRDLDLVIVHRGEPASRPIRVQQFGRLLRLILAAREPA